MLSFHVVLPVIVLLSNPFVTGIPINPKGHKVGSSQGWAGNVKNWEGSYPNYERETKCYHKWMAKWAHLPEPERLEKVYKKCKIDGNHPATAVIKHTSVAAVTAKVLAEKRAKEAAEKKKKEAQTPEGAPGAPEAVPEIPGQVPVPQPEPVPEPNGVPGGIPVPIPVPAPRLLPRPVPIPQPAAEGNRDVNPPPQQGNVKKSPGSLPKGVKKNGGRLPKPRKVEQPLGRALREAMERHGAPTARQMMEVLSAIGYSAQWLGTLAIGALIFLYKTAIEQLA